MNDLLSIDSNNINSFPSSFHAMIMSDYDLAKIKSLIDKGYDINKKDNRSLTMLHYAFVFRREKDIIKLLINSGADVNAKDDRLMTPLHTAIQFKYDEDIIELLIKKGSDVNAKDKNLFTPLHYSNI